MSTTRHNVLLGEISFFPGWVALTINNKVVHPHLPVFFSMKIPGHGKFAIYIQEGIQHGLWQV